jgi:hypothetical protein
VTVTAAGAATVADGFRRVADDLTAGMADVNMDAARVIAGAVHPPVQSGALARTVTPVADATTASVTAGGPTVPYARVQEYRHRYLARALDTTTAQVADIIAAGVAGRLDDVKGA